ncbi:hypothetical protein FTO70_06275 [Methanosarcina sp. KYL-1]|uniref:hypothetical protein n=1 Tax=Methanosarcina sp. KYL-1 TaxID=2602068 RepID=UPI0021010085|nr:hypothetical protein [Methanosarcina sp. KYL-1]MCQ1535301.1 hypothetical protein [Methanosarcina sp. KYL-1]
MKIITILTHNFSKYIIDIMKKVGFVKYPRHLNGISLEPPPAPETHRNSDGKGAGIRGVPQAEESECPYIRINILKMYLK